MTDNDELRHLRTLVGFMLRRAQVAVSRRFAEGFAGLDVRQTQLGVISIVDAIPGSTPSRIGRLLGIKRANIGPLLDGLEDRGLLVRRPSPDDRRAVSLHLTAAGREMLAELRHREAMHEACITAALQPGERQHLLDLLKKIELAASRSDEDCGTA